MRTLYLDQDEELILALYRAPTLRQTVGNIRQILRMATVDEEMTDLLRRTLDDITMLEEEDFREMQFPDPLDLYDPPEDP